METTGRGDALSVLRLASKRGCFDAYVDNFERSGGSARDWFVEHLRPD